MPFSRAATWTSLAGVLLGVSMLSACGGGAANPTDGTGGVMPGAGGTATDGTATGGGGSGTGGTTPLPEYVISCRSEATIVPDPEGEYVVPEVCTDYYGDGPPAYPGCGDGKCTRTWAKATCSVTTGAGDVYITYYNANPDPSKCTGEWVELE